MKRVVNASSLDRLLKLDRVPAPLALASKDVFTEPQHVNSSLASGSCNGETWLEVDDRRAGYIKSSCTPRINVPHQHDSTMRLRHLACTVPSFAHAARIVLSNDDGWAEINIRAFYEALKAAGNDVVVSAPAHDRSGTGMQEYSTTFKALLTFFPGSTDLPPTALIFGPCEFDSCPRGSPAIGFNASDNRLNYVNSFPVTSIKYSINTLAPKLLGGPAELAVAGPNVGGWLHDFLCRTILLTESQQIQDSLHKYLGQ